MVFFGVYPFEQAERASRVPKDPGVMAGRHSVGPHFFGKRHDGPELDGRIADQTGIGGLSLLIGFDKIIDHRSAKYVTDIHHFQGYIQLTGHQRHMVRREVFISGGKMDAEEAMAPVFEHAGGNEGIDAPA